MAPAFSNQTLDMSGFILSYQGQGSQVMSVTLTGKTPAVSTTSGSTILNVHEVDRTGHVITSSQVIQTAVVSGPDQTSAAHPDMNGQTGVLDQILGMFRSLFGI